MKSRQFLSINYFNRHNATKKDYQAFFFWMATGIIVEPYATVIQEKALKRKEGKLAHKARKLARKTGKNPVMRPH